MRVTGQTFRNFRSSKSRPDDVVLPQINSTWRITGHRLNHCDRITLDPAICHGKPCIRGLRYPVESLLELLAGGMTTEEVLADYQDIERDDVLAALSYAARLTHVKRA